MTYEASADIVIRAPRERVWKAVTEPAIIKRYFFGTDLDTTWEVGSPLLFRGEWEGKTYEDRGTVLAFEPMQSLSFDYWSSMSGHEDRPELRQIVRYDLAAHADGVRVSVKQSNIAKPELAEHSTQNWRQVLEGMKKVVEESP